LPFEALAHLLPAVLDRWCTLGQQSFDEIFRAAVDVKHEAKTSRIPGPVLYEEADDYSALEILKRMAQASAPAMQFAQVERGQRL